MPYGRGFGMGRGRGIGLGFRGAYAAWPYIGRGRGGLPRCGYFFAGPAYGWPAYTYYNPSLTGDDPNLVQAAAADLRERLAGIKARLTGLEQQINA